MARATDFSSRWHSNKAEASGFSLLEILIAVLVLSIGFLGIASLQVRSLANNNSAMMRTQAVLASYTILDAMRADRAAARAGTYDGTVTVGSCPAAGAALASQQLADWCAGTAGTGEIPNGLAALGAGARGTVACNAAGACTVTVVFDDVRGSGGSATETVVTRGML